MKTFAKIFCILLCLCLITATAVGCGKKDSSTGGSNVQNTSSVTSDGTTADNTSSTPNASTPTESGTASNGSTDGTTSSNTPSDGTQSTVTSSDDTTSESGTTPPPQTNNDLSVLLESKQNGDTVTVTASVKNNPGLVAFKFQVTFDNAKLTPDNMAQSDLKLGITSNVKQGAAAKGEVSVLYIGTAGFKTNGQLFTLTFKVNKNANGTADFRIKSDNSSFLSTDAATYLNVKTFGTSVELK
ncbi:MAG: hypothetical protein J6S13_00210 [Clostridia bacterium]|nr:hypothetical protein [Clostridia bacterium]